jgi:hypothetical protein
MQNSHSSLLPPTILTVKLQVLSPLFSCKFLILFLQTHSVLAALMHLVISPYLFFLILSWTLCVLSLALISVISLFVGLLECMSFLPF